MSLPYRSVATLQAEGEMPVEADVQRSLADDVPANENLEWACAMRRKLQDLRRAEDVARAPERHHKVDEIDTNGHSLRRGYHRSHADCA